MICPFCKANQDMNIYHILTRQHMYHIRKLPNGYDKMPLDVLRAYLHTDKKTLKKILEN